MDYFQPLYISLVFQPSGFSFTSCSAFLREYHYIDLPRKWAEAQHYCREKYTDLATFESMDDINKLNRAQLEDEYVWIGLNSWRWSATGKPSTTGYQKWGYGEPNNKRAVQHCVILYTNGTWMRAVIHSIHFCATKVKTIIYEYTHIRVSL
uniref:C-type lectin domain-containing protein n=1 Tax=Salarias fasciatus TaxID=181472 RepID=A0A672FAR8_SALFA